MYPIDRIREEFPALARQTYLDIAARCLLPLRTHKAISGYLETCVSEGARKDEWLANVEFVRAQLAGLLHSTPEEVAFVKAATEGINAFAHSVRIAPGDNVVLCPGIEHPSNIYPWLHLRNWGVEVRLATAHDGQLTIPEVARLADRRTRVIIAPHVSFTTGARADLRALSQVAHALGALLFVDCSQSLGLLDVDLHRDGIDALVGCVHKGLLAPYGLAVLVCRRELISSLIPVYIGRAGIDLQDKREFVVGDLKTFDLISSAQRFEYGSYNFPGIYGLGASLELLEGWRVPAVEAHILALGRQLAGALEAAGFELAGPREARAQSHIVGVLRTDADALALELESLSIRVSARVGVLRAAVAPHTTQDEVDHFVETVTSIATTPRARS